MLQLGPSNGTEERESSSPTSFASADQQAGGVADVFADVRTNGQILRNRNILGVETAAGLVPDSIGGAGQSNTTGVATFGRGAGVGSDPFTRSRLTTFLTLHFAAFAAQIAAMVNFLITDDHWFFSAILLPFLFSGAFCSYAAWHCDAPLSCPNVLPLKKLKLPIALLMALPVGLGQGVIVLLALEEYMMQKDGAYGSESPFGPSGASVVAHTRPVANKFHLKAINGLFEGLLSSAVLLYAYWSMNYPKCSPITKESWWGETTFLAALGFIQFFSAGLGLLELDFCTSRTISRRMRRSLSYEAIHWLFRVTEVISRCSIFISFMVTTRQFVSWWWYPLAVDFLATIGLVALYGGAETTWLVRFLCSIPCTFANVFLFIDSPYKRRAAMRLSRCLTAKHGFTLVLLPLLMPFATDDYRKELRHFWDLHVGSNLISAIAVPLYWPLLWYLTSKSMHFNKIVDIYSACESGSVSAVRSAMRELTHSAAVGLNINAVDINGYTPLMCAALHGNVKVCRLLLQEGAFVNIRMADDSRICRKSCMLLVRRRWTAIHMAAAKGHAEVVGVLIDGIAKGIMSAEDFQDAMGDTPLHVAVRNGHTEVVRVILRARQEWCTPNARGQRPIDVASGVRSEGARRLLEGGDPLFEDMEVRSSSTCRASPLLRQASGPELQCQAWPQVQLSIRRSSQGEGQLMAPGLCSYIASSCGGALGRIFLAEAAQRRADPMLTMISEAETFEPDESVATVRGAASSVCAPKSWSPTMNDGEHGPAMEDLEPVDDDGRSIPWWLAMASSRHAATSSSEASGRKFMRIPDEAVLGEGSYGLVWRAKDRCTAKWYAVKNIRTSQKSGPSVASRECEVADHIRLKPHPCIVKLHHVHNFTDCGLYVLVMEFCSNGDVLERIKAAKQVSRRRGAVYVPPAEALGWIGQVFLGLEHMHLRMDTLLRDLKPENVVLTADGRAKLTDFGFGRFGVESSGRWSFGIPTGSPGYVAPEVLRREEYDSSADLFSLGVLVWVLLSGGLIAAVDPFPPLGQMRHQTDFQAHFNDWLRLAQCLAHPERHGAVRLPEDARDFVARLTHRRPDQRMRHADIRAHSFMHPCQLPAFDAPPNAVEAWLSRGCGAGRGRGASSP